MSCRASEKWLEFKSGCNKVVGADRRSRIWEACESVDNAFLRGCREFDEGVGVRDDARVVRSFKRSVSSS